MKGSGWPLLFPCTNTLPFGTYLTILSTWALLLLVEEYPVTESLPHQVSTAHSLPSKIRVRLPVIHNARIKHVGKYQTCMFSKLLLLCKQSRSGNPPTLTLLPDGRLVMVVGWRIPPYGLRATISTDSSGEYWSPWIVLRTDAGTMRVQYIIITAYST